MTFEVRRAGGGATANTDTKIIDADSDTQVQVEESADEDIIRFDTAGTERLNIGATGDFNFSGNSGTEINFNVNEPVLKFWVQERQGLTL